MCSLDPCYKYLWGEPLADEDPDSNLQVGFWTAPSKPGLYQQVWNGQCSAPFADQRPDFPLCVILLLSTVDGGGLPDTGVTVERFLSRTLYLRANSLVLCIIRSSTNSLISKKTHPPLPTCAHNSLWQSLKTFNDLFPFLKMSTKFSIPKPTYNVKWSQST